MGRLSELFWFINAEKIPSNREARFYYHYLSKTPELVKIRRQYRKDLKRRRDASQMVPVPRR